VGVLTILAVVGARLREPYRPDLVRWALGVFAWVLGNGIVGAAVVLLELSPLSVIGHFVLALGALWNALMLVDRAGREPVERDEPRPWAATPRFVAAARWLLGLTTLALLTGTVVTGSGPHAGDERADRLALEVGTVARIHGVTVVVLLALTLAVVRMARRGDASPSVTQRADQLVVVLVAQAAIGYWQYFTGVPALLVAFHVLGAVLVWLAVLRLWLALRAPAPAAVAATRSPAAAAGAGRTAGGATATA
jgi:cytochrome c oxidase assembly protein subunit 15